MWTYLIKRVIWFVPSLFLLAVFSFYLSRAAPDDPAERLLGLEGVDELTISDPVVRKIEYERLVKKLGRNKPLFYWSVVPNNYPNQSLHSQVYHHKNLVKSWLHQRMRWDYISASIEKLASLESAIIELKDSISFSQKNKLNQSLVTLKRVHTPEETLHVISTIEKIVESNPTSNIERNILLLKEARNSIISMGENQISFIWPKLRIHGFDNQFHQWIGQLLHGDFGLSIADGRPATKRISEAFYWTLFLVIISLFFSLIISIPSAIYSTMRKEQWPDRLISNFSYLVYALPLFWLATLLVTFCTTDTYSKWLHIFPAVSSNYIGYAEGFWPKFSQFGKSLILPVFCLVLHSLAYLIKQMKTSMINESGSFYTLTARAKGLSEWKVYIKHIFPNAIIPIITLIVDAFPGALAGSVIIEVIFNIPGMGRLMYNAIFSADWNIVYGVIILLGLVTVVAYLVGDVLYSLFNPKIRFSKK